MGQLTRNEVFTLAVQRYSDTVYRTAVHNCRCTADAEDVVQDVLKNCCTTTASLRVRSISKHGCCGWPSTAAGT